jgi:hypothetical protein
MALSALIERNHKIIISVLTLMLVGFIIICSTPLSFICEWLFGCGAH